MNAIVIEQTPCDAKLAFEVHHNASIHRMRLARAKVSSRPIDEAPRSHIAIEFTYKSKALPSPPGVLRLEIALRMTGIEQGEPGGTALAEDTSRDKKAQPAVLVEPVYEVDYELAEGFQASSEHVKAFKDGNAIFNAWPFFREYLQNNLQRMGLPALTAPFLRLEPKPSAGKRARPAAQVE